jgi:hypothetical protein
MIVRFTAPQVAACGLPHRGAAVQYDEQRRLAGYSAWLGKSPWHEPGIDRLVALADEILKQTYH